MKIELDEKQVEFMTRALRVLSVELADSDPLQARYANETRVYLQQELEIDETSKEFQDAEASLT